MGGREWSGSPHHGHPHFEDAVAALQDQQAGYYTNDEELAALR